MIDHQQPTKALALLAHLVPREVLDKARVLAREIEREDYIKDFIAKRGILVATAGAVVTLLTFFLTIGALGRFLKLFPSMAPWVALIAVLFGLLLWLCVIIGFMYFFLSSLRNKAIEKHAQEESRKQQGLYF